MSSQTTKVCSKSLEVMVAQSDFVLEVRARDLRFLRAAKDVLKKYSLERRPPDPAQPTVCVVDVSGPRTPYELRFLTDWSAPPTCTCPDARKGGAKRAGGFCKHAIAAALKWDDLRCQLLDILI